MVARGAVRSPEPFAPARLAGEPPTRACPAALDLHVITAVDQGMRSTSMTPGDLSVVAAPARSERAIQRCLGQGVVAALTGFLTRPRYITTRVILEIIDEPKLCAIQGWLLTAEA